MNNNEFDKFARRHQGISSTTLSRYQSAVDAYINPSIIAQLLFLASVDPKADISLYLNTPGGQVSSGLAIYDTIQLIQPDVATICTGMAASMGSVLLCAGEKGKRSALPHSRVMVHQPLGGVLKVRPQTFSSRRRKLRNSARSCLASSPSTPANHTPKSPLTASATSG